MPSQEQDALDAKINAYSKKFAAEVARAPEPLSLMKRFELNLAFYDFMTTTGNKAAETSLALQTYVNKRCNDEINKYLGQNIAAPELLAFRLCKDMKSTLALAKQNYKDAATIANKFNAFYNTSRIASEISKIEAHGKPYPFEALLALHRDIHYGFLGRNRDNFKIVGQDNKSAGQTLAEGFCNAKLQEDLGVRLSPNLTKLAGLHPDTVPTMKSLFKTHPEELEMQLNEVNQYFEGQISRQVAALKAKHPKGNFPLDDQLDISEQITKSFINAQREQIGKLHIPQEEKDQLFALTKSLAIKEAKRVVGVYIDPEHAQSYKEVQASLKAPKTVAERAPTPSPNRQTPSLTKVEEQLKMDLAEAFAHEVVTGIAAKAEKEEKPLAKQEGLDLKAKIKSAVESVLSGLRSATKILQGVFEAFRDACGRIKGFDTIVNESEKLRLIKQTCNTAINKAKFEAKRALTTIIIAAKGLKMGIAAAATLMFSAAEGAATAIKNIPEKIRNLKKGPEGRVQK